MTRAILRSLVLLVVLSLTLGLSACSKDEKKGDKEKEGEEGGGEEEPEAKPELDEATLKTLSATDIPGYDRVSEQASKRTAMMTYTAQELGPDSLAKASAMVTLGPCLGCQPMDLETWTKNKDNMMGMLSKAHIENPDLIFEIYELDLGGRTAIATYTLSFVRTADGKGTSSSNGVNVFYNDGVNQFTAMAFAEVGSGVSTSSKEEVLAKISRASMEKAVQDIFKGFEAQF